MKRLLSILFWSVIAAAFIGPGTVTTAASAGASYGYALLWALAFSIVATIVLQEATARVTVVSGRNLGEAIRLQFEGSGASVLVIGLVLGAIVLGNAAYEAGNILGAAAGAELGLGASRRALTLVIGLVAATVLWLGTPRTVANILGVTVAFMGIAFLVTAVRLAPDPATLAASSLVPSIPAGSGLLVLGLIGTTVVPYNLFLGSGIAAGQQLRDLRFGITVAVVLGGIISMGILVVGAAVEGDFSYAAVAAALEGRLGAGAGSLFAWGLFAAGLSSAITAPLAAAITARSLLADRDVPGDQERWGSRAPRYRIVWGGVLLVGVAFGLAGIRPIPAIILAQALNGIVLPFAALFLLGVVNDRRVMGDQGMNGTFGNIAMGVVVLVTVVLGAAGVMRAGAAAFGLAPPGERLLLGAAAVIALLLAMPVLRRLRSVRAVTTASRRNGAAAGMLALAMCTAAGCAGLARGPSPEVLMRPGVSRELAEHRAGTLSGVEYHLTLDLSGQDSIPGQVSIVVARDAVFPDLVLDYRGLSLGEITANGQPVADHVWQNGHIRIPSHHLVPGDNVLSLRFTSAMAAAGASVIRTEEPPAAPAIPGDSLAGTPEEPPAGAGDVYLYSLLVPADANQLFPSFDQPDLKGIFVFDALAPTGWRILSNAPLDELSVAGEREHWRFLPTAPISTYLFAFAAGPWRVATEAEPPEGRDPMSLFVRASRAEEADADTIIAINRRALDWLERYFDMAYPFAKYDMLLAPAFPFGGMEHPGAVFYNESRFIFREPPTLTDRLGRAATIYHEVAHQWFGDLVTMRWFDDLWLKEGFSTYMAARMQDELNPGTGAWKTFYLRNKPAAYAVDATTGTTPVWQDLENLDLAKGNYGPIVYNKAPSILKQLERLVGEAAFQTGLQELLREHAYANITWRDLLTALERTSGQSLEAFGEHYILRAGMPAVETVLTLDGPVIRELALAQRPAREIPGDSGGWWPGRLQVRLGYDDRDDVVLPVAFTGDTTIVEGAAGLPAPDWVFANEGDFGYGTFLLDELSAEALIQRVGTLDDELLRAMTWGALWDLVREGRLAPDRYVELALDELPGEADEQIAGFFMGRARFALQRYLPAGSPRATALQLRFEELMAARMSDPELEYGQRKESLDALLGGARSPAAQAILLELLRGDRIFAGEPLRHPSRWSAVQTLIALGHPAADSLHRAERERDDSPEAARRDFVAGAAHPDAERKAEYFRRYLEDPDLNEEWVTASLGAFNHPEHEALTLPHLRAALDRLPWIRDNRRIFFLPQWVNSFIGGQSSREALAVVDAYLAENPDLPLDLRRKVLQARDALEEGVRVKAAAAAP